MGELKDANNITSNSLTIGQTLRIPTSIDEVPNENVYIVKAGDSLYKIAGMYGMTVNELKALNNLTSNNLSIGQRLKVVESAPEVTRNTYVVVPGDSLYSIAKRFGINVEALKQANNKTSNLLSIGEVLMIPMNPNNRVYVVKAGDTLYGIARMYNTTVDAIKSANNLINNTLSIGMNLIIP